MESEKASRSIGKRLGSTSKRKGQTLKLGVEADEIILNAKNILAQLIESKKTPMSHVGSLSNVPGVYAIYQGDRLVFVGATDNLQRRLRSLRGGSHILSWRLRKKLLGKGNARDYINECSVKVKELKIETAKLVGQMGITLLSPQLNIELNIFEAT